MFIMPGIMHSNINPPHSSNKASIGLQFSHLCSKQLPLFYNDVWRQGFHAKIQCFNPRAATLELLFPKSTCSISTHFPLRLEQSFPLFENEIYLQHMHLLPTFNLQIFLNFSCNFLQFSELILIL